MKEEKPIPNVDSSESKVMRSSSDNPDRPSATERAELDLARAFAIRKNTLILSPGGPSLVAPTAELAVGVWEVIGDILNQSVMKVKRDLSSVLCKRLLDLPLEKVIPGSNSSLATDLACRAPINVQLFKSYGLGSNDRFQSARTLGHEFVTWIRGTYSQQRPAASDALQLLRAATQHYGFCCVVFSVNSAKDHVVKEVFGPKASNPSSQGPPKHSQFSSNDTYLFHYESLFLFLREDPSSPEDVEVIQSSVGSEYKDTTPSTESENDLRLVDCMKWSVNGLLLNQKNMGEALTMLDDLNVRNTIDLVRLDLTATNVRDRLKKNFPVKRFLTALQPLVKERLKESSETSEEASDVRELLRTIAELPENRVRIISRMFQECGISNWKADLSGVTATDLVEAVDGLGMGEAQVICNEVWERKSFNEEVANEILNSIRNAGKQQDDHVITESALHQKLGEVNVLEKRIVRALERIRSFHKDSVKEECLDKLLEELNSYRDEISSMLQHVAAVDSSSVDDADNELISISANYTFQIQRSKMDRIRADFPADPSQVVSFVGKTHSGKSTLLCHLLVHTRFRPKVGRSGSQVGTTANIQVYDDHLLVKEDANIATPTLPMRFLDVEGADAIPPQDEGEDDLKKRVDCVNDFPRLCYMISNVIVYVVDGHPADHLLYNNIVDYAASSIRHIPSACPPSLLIVFNKMPFNDFIADVDHATSLYLDGDPSKGEAGHGHALEKVFHRIRMIMVPIKGHESMFRVFLQQIERIKVEICALLQEQLSLRAMNLTLYDRQSWCKIVNSVALNMDNPDFVLTALELGQTMESEHIIVSKAFSFARLLTRNRKHVPTNSQIIKVAAQLAACLSVPPATTIYHERMREVTGADLSRFISSPSDSEELFTSSFEDPPLSHSEARGAMAKDGDAGSPRRSVRRMNSMPIPSSSPNTPSSHILKRHQAYSDAVQKAKIERHMALIAMLYNKVRQLERCSAICPGVVDANSMEELRCNQSRGGHALAHRSDTAIPIHTISALPKAVRVLCAKHIKKEQVVIWGRNGFQEETSNIVSVTEAQDTFRQTQKLFESLRFRPKEAFIETVHLISSVPLEAVSDMCVICFKNPCNVRLFPCNHAFCQVCVMDSQDATGHMICPLSSCETPYRYHSPFELLSHQPEFIVSPSRVQDLLRQMLSFSGAYCQSLSDCRRKMVVISVIGRIWKGLRDHVVHNILPMHDAGRPADQRGKTKAWLKHPLGLFFQSICTGKGAFFCSAVDGDEFRRSAIYHSLDGQFMIVHYNVDYVDYQDYNFLDAMLPSPSTLARYTSNLVLWMDSTTSWRDVMEAPSQTCFIDNSFSPPLLDISAINRKPKLFTVKMEEAAHEISQLRSNPTSPLCWAVTCEVLMYPRSQPRSTADFPRDIFAHFRSVESVRRMLHGISRLVRHSEQLGLGFISRYELDVLRQYVIRQALVIVFYDCCYRYAVQDTSSAPLFKSKREAASQDKLMENGDFLSSDPRKTQSSEERGEYQVISSIPPELIQPVLDRLWTRCFDEICREFHKLLPFLEDSDNAPLSVKGKGPLLSSADACWCKEDEAKLSLEQEIEFVVVEPASQFCEVWNSYTAFIANWSKNGYFRQILGDSEVSEMMIPFLYLTENVLWGKDAVKRRRRMGSDDLSSGDIIDLAMWLSSRPPSQCNRKAEMTNGPFSSTKLDKLGTYGSVQVDKDSLCCSLCLRGQADGHGVDDPPFCQHPLCFRCADALSLFEQSVEDHILRNKLQLEENQRKAFKERFFACPICNVLDPIRIRTYLTNKFLRQEKVSSLIIDCIWSGVTQDEFLNSYTNVDPSRLTDISMVTPIVARARLDGEWVSVKYFTFKSQEGYNAFKREVSVLCVLAHPRLVPTLGAHIPSYGSLTPFIVTRYYPDTLFREIWTDRLLSWPIALQYLTDVAEALSFLHHAGIHHRDVKPCNIVISKSSGRGSRALLLDMGSAAVYSGDVLRTRAVREPHYRAPEVEETFEYSAECDVYSFGMTMRIVIMKVFNYSLTAMDRWKEQSLPVHPSLTAVTSLIEQCTTAAPERRPTMARIQAILQREMVLLRDALQRAERMNLLVDSIDLTAAHGLYDISGDTQSHIRNMLNALAGLDDRQEERNLSYSSRVLASSSNTHLAAFSGAGSAGSPILKISENPLRTVVSKFLDEFFARYGEGGFQYIPGACDGETILHEITSFIERLLLVLFGIAHNSSKRYQTSKRNKKIPAVFEVQLTDRLVELLYDCLFRFLSTADMSENIPLDAQMVSLRDITLEDLEADPKVIAIADKLIDTICLVQNFAAEKKPYQKAIILHEAFTGIAGHLQKFHNDPEAGGADLLWTAMHFVLVKSQVRKLHTHHKLCINLVRQITEEHMLLVANLSNIEGFILQIRQYSTKLFHKNQILPTSMVKDQVFAVLKRQSRDAVVWFLSVLDFIIDHLPPTSRAAVDVPSTICEDGTDHLCSSWLDEVLSILGIQLQNNRQCTERKTTANVANNEDREIIPYAGPRLLFERTLPLQLYSEIEGSVLDFFS